MLLPNFYNLNFTEIWIAWFYGNIMQSVHPLYLQITE